MNIFRTFTVTVYLFVLFFLLLNGCAARNIAREYSLDESKGTGIMLVSLTQAGLPSSLNMFADLRGVDNDYKSAVAVTDIFFSADWRCPPFGISTEDKPCGRLAVVELPQGEYEFYSWHGGSGGGPGTVSTSVQARQEFSKRFKITAGKVVYIGNIHFSIILYTKGLLGIPVRSPSYDMKINDMRERDLPLFYSKYPKITSDKILIDIIQ